MFRLFIADMKMMLRNRQALFWTVMFPLMFTFIFGAFFGKEKMGGGKIDLVSKSNSELAQSVERAVTESEVFKINEMADESQARKELNDGKVSAVLIVPESFGQNAQGSATNVKLVYDPANSTTYSVLSGLLEGILTQVNYKIQNAKPIYTVEADKTNSRKLNYFDFILIGLIGMALMNSSVQGVAISLSKYREDKILKRITTTPLQSWKFIGAEICSRLILNFIQVSLILLVGVYIFNAHIYGNIVLIYLFSLIGALLFQSIGYAIAALSKTTDAAEGMATAVTVPMMFLAGVFFPIDQLPKWVYAVVQYLPLAPLLRIIRGIGLDAASPIAKPFDLVLVIIWIVIMLALTLRRFRMSEE